MRTRYALKTLRAPVEGETRTLCGSDYIVIPVVALVEGVRHAGGSPAPELVLAESFGRHVETWNGRPIVVNHPVVDGKACLASSPEILEESYLGTLMASKVDGGKLIVEAWLDVEAIQASSSEGVAAMWKRLVDGETVEVSVGAIVYTKRGDGEWDGKKYSGSWDIVIPDHLAFLDGGQIGACSVEDGCGTFRTHSVGGVRLSEGARRTMATATAGLKTVKSGDTGGVSEGGVGKSGSSREACGCGDKKGLVAGQPEASQLETGRAWARMLWNAETFDHDRRQAMQRALTDKFGASKGSYVVTYNDRKVVFEQYNGDRFALYEMEYESDSDNGITFSGEPVEVVIQSKTVPVGGNSGKGKQMSKALQSLAAKSKAKAHEDDETDAEEAEEESAVKGKKKKMSSEVNVPTHILSLAEKLDAAETLEDVEKALTGTPIGKRLSSAMKVCAAARGQAVKVIQASSSGKHFTADMLATVEFDVLSQMAVSFLAADKKAAEEARAAAGEEGDEVMEGEEEIEEEDEDETDGEVAGLSSIMDFDGQADRANRPAKKKLSAGGAGAGGSGKVARLAAPGKASYGGRAAQGGGGGNGRIGAPPDVFAFDDQNQYIPPKAKAQA